MPDMNELIHAIRGAPMRPDTGQIVAAAPRAGAHIVTAEVDIHAGPPLQYGAERFTSLPTMRDVRLSQRRPDTYGRLTKTPESRMNSQTQSYAIRWPRRVTDG